MDKTDDTPQGLIVKKLMDVGYVPLVKTDAGPTEETTSSTANMPSLHSLHQHTSTEEEDEESEAKKEFGLDIHPKMDQQ